MGLDVLSPWDAFRWFDRPRETQIILTASTRKVSIAPHEVRRVALVIGSDGVNPLSFTTIGSAAPATGIVLLPSQAPLVLTHATLGNLVQVEWFVIDAVNTSINVIEVLLREWPQKKPGSEHYGG